jgi:hypothetical protein
MTGQNVAAVLYSYDALEETFHEVALLGRICNPTAWIIRIYNP